MNFECRKDWGAHLCIFQKPIFCALWGAKFQTPGLATVISKFNWELPRNVSRNGGYMSSKGLGRVIGSEEMAIDSRLGAHNL